MKLRPHMVEKRDGPLRAVHIQKHFWCSKAEYVKLCVAGRKSAPKTNLEINIKYFIQDYFHHRVLNYT